MLELDDGSVSHVLGQVHAADAVSKPCPLPGISHLHEARLTAGVCAIAFEDLF